MSRSGVEFRRFGAFPSPIFSPRVMDCRIPGIVWVGGVAGEGGGAVDRGGRDDATFSS